MCMTGGGREQERDRGQGLARKEVDDFVDRFMSAYHMYLGDVKMREI
jgi:hypothetical protein